MKKTPDPFSSLYTGVESPPTGKLEQMLVCAANRFRLRAFQMKIIFNCFLLSIFILTIAGCGKDYSAIEKMSWEKMEIICYYKVDSNIQEEKLVVDDLRILENIRKNLIIRRRAGLWSIGVMETHKINLHMSDGRRFEVYVLDEDRITYHSLDNPSESYSSDVDNLFVRCLRDMFKVKTGRDPTF